MKDKHIRMWFKQARALADNVPCLSRAIGSVIVNPATNTIVSTGYNGTSRGLPDCDSREHLEEYVWPQLNEDELNAAYLFVKSKCPEYYKYGKFDHPDEFADAFEGCKQCPRKLVGARSGERLELCQCSHSEENAVNNAALAGHSTKGCYIFCWCGIPCVECSSAIIQAGISKVFCLKQDSGPANNAYESWRSLWRFNKAGVVVDQYSEEWILQ